MPPGNRNTPYVSPNRLEGSLEDVALPRLVDSCRRHLVNGVIRILTEDSEGVLELRGGVVDAAQFGELTGDAAIERMFALDAGLYELAQTLPTFEGDLGEGAQCWGNLEEVPLAQVMRHCEDHALSCTLVVVNEFDRGEIVYDTGDITAVALNGEVDDDAIVPITQWTTGKFRMTAPPLKLDIEGWPVVTGQPTAPFQIDHLAERPRHRVARGTPSPPVRRPTLPGMPVPVGKGRVPPSRRTLGRTVAEPELEGPAKAVAIVDDEPPDVQVQDREWRTKPHQRAPSVVEIEADLPPDDDNYYTDPDMDLSWQPTRIRPPTENELSAATRPPAAHPRSVGRAQTAPPEPPVVPDPAPAPQFVASPAPDVAPPAPDVAEWNIAHAGKVATPRPPTPVPQPAPVRAPSYDDLEPDVDAKTDPARPPVDQAAYYPPMDDFVDVASMRTNAPLPVDPSPSASFELAPPPRPLRLATTSTEWNDSSGTLSRVFATFLFLLLAVFGAFYFLTYG